LAQAVCLTTTATHTRRAALAIVNAGRPANNHVTYGTLARALKPGVPTRPGRRNKLPAASEAALADAISEFQSNGFNITKGHLVEAVSNIIKDLPVEQQAQWKDGRPSEHWVRLFCRRNSMKLRRENVLESVRAKAMTKENFATHFAILAHLIDKHNITPERMSNWDETGFSFGKLGASNEQVLSDPAVGQSVTHGVSVCGDAEHTTLAASITADGRALAPLVLLPGVEAKYRTLVDGVTQTPVDYLPLNEIVCYKNPSGVNGSIMNVWVDNYLQQTAELRASGKTLIIFDGYSSHLSISVPRKCFDNNVIAYALPSHTSHVTQPLDVAVFGPMKAHTQQRLSAFSNSPAKKHASLNVYGACEIITQAYWLSMTPDNIKAGFLRTGIHPINPNIFTDASFELSRTYQTDATPDEAWTDVASRFFMEGPSLASSVNVLRTGTVDTGAGCHVTTEAVMAVLEQRVAAKRAEETRKVQLAKDREEGKEQRALAREGRMARAAARVAARLAASEAAEERSLRSLVTGRQRRQATVRSMAARRAVAKIRGGGGCAS